MVRMSIVNMKFTFNQVIEADSAGIEPCNEGESEYHFPDRTKNTGNARFPQFSMARLSVF